MSTKETISENKLEMILGVVFLVICIIWAAYHDTQSSTEKTKQIESCNKLKATAIAASAPEPHCAF